MPQMPQDNINVGTGEIYDRGLSMHIHEYVD